MRKLGDRWIDLWILLVYILLSLVMSYPLVLHMTTHVAGRHMDTRVFQWNNWWVKEAFFNRLNLNYTDYIYYPSGVNLATHSFNWVSSFISIPLSVLFGSVVAYNLTFLFTIFFSAFGMYSMVFHLVRRRDAAFIAGLVFAFSPYRLAGNWDGQMNLANVQWLPLFVLFVLRTMTRKRVRDAVLAGIALALASLDCWFFMIFLGLWIGLFLAYSLVFERDKWSWRVLGLHLLVAVVCGLLIGPFLWPVIAASEGDMVGRTLHYYSDYKSADLLAFIVPSRDHPLLSQYAAPIQERFTHWRPAFLGYSASVLAAYAILIVRRKSIFWFLSGLFFAALALGPYLMINGIKYPNILTPYRLLLTVFPALRIIRQPNRFNIMVALSLAALVGIACADFCDRLQRQSSGRLPTWGRYIAMFLAGALILFEYLAIPCPILSSQLSPFYDALAQEEGDFAILELPLEDLVSPRSTKYSRRSMYGQILHRKKLVNGYVARAPSTANAFIHSSPMLTALQLQTKLDPTLHNIPAELGVLAANNIRYIVIHKSPMPPHPAVTESVLGVWRTAFGPNPLYEDQEIIVYRTQLAPDQHLAPILRFGGKLGVTNIQAQRTRLSNEQFLDVGLTWKALDVLDREYNCSLSVAGPTGIVARTESRGISPSYPTSHWPTGVVVAERFAISLDPSLPAGDYYLSIRVTDAASGQELDTLDHPVQIGDDALPFTPALGDVQFPLNIAFGEKLLLLGYSDLRQDGNRLVLKMYWQALRTMKVDYKAFIHLIRLDEEVIVAQRDAMPYDWPIWEKQEVFVDRIELDITGVEPGEYRMAVGVYEWGGERFTALDGDGHPIPDNRLILDEVVMIRNP